ncbi:MAG TPA: DUF4091 domain-containing protein [Armatimonadetes bacterium]|jgi:hypothetical protein|nr:DUF4091 domain-containing protein [Armatimonadota bacterium]
MRFLRLLPVLLVLTTGPACADWQVWTLARTERVLREEPAGTGIAVQLSAARNEWECFQVLMRSDQPVAGIRLEPSDLKGPQGAVLPARDARLYRQHQLQITEASFRNEAFRPGWYPDPLIPFDHPLTRQPLGKARFKAIPFDLPANETHGFLVDLYVPTNAAPGVYRGDYRLTAPGRPAITVPVTLTVWNITLPRVPTLQTALGDPAARLRSYYQQRAKEGKEPEPADWAALGEQCAELLSRHRINATPPSGSLVPQAQPDGSFRIPKEQVDRFREFVDRYHVNAYSVPRPTTVVKDPEAEREKLHAWLKAWDEAARVLNRPHVTFYTYLRDEPNDEEAYRFVQKWGRAMRAARSVVKVLVVEQTWTQNDAWGDLYGAVDIWCPLWPLFKEESARKRQALGETVWCYTALCQRDPTPWWLLDTPLLNYRVPTWIAWRYGIRGLLYWGGMAYWQQVDDPWTNPKTLDRRNRRPDGKGPLYNGEGSLLYPGRAVGYDGIAESLRVKALRDSIEDYEYLAQLEAAGKRAQADEVVRPLASSWFEWEKDSAAYEKARVALARLLE